MIQAASGNAGFNNLDALTEGALVTGTLKSIKGMCAFIQVGSQNKIPIIGRLHRVETPASSTY